jgi:hypothetical protein
VGKKNGIHKNKTPVYIGYFTAWVDDKDEIHSMKISIREISIIVIYQITIQNVNDGDHSQSAITSLRFLIR